jgi:hypothetical protein
MPVARYEISADEAWTHTSQPPNRYWCFFGGVFGPESSCDRLETSLRAIVAAKKLRGEIKWSSVTDQNIQCYKLLVDTFFTHIENGNLVYRQMFLDRSFVHIPSPNDPPLSPLDVQFRICYQFLKHSFGLRYLANSDPACDHHVTIRLDEHSSQHHKDELRSYVERIPEQFNSRRLITKVQYVNSKKFLRLQVCDLIMGAAGSYGNKMHKRREAGRRGMTNKQKQRLDIALYIYGKLRNLDASERGTKGFNWFETTGTDGDAENRLRHKIRIWKFIPNRFQKDKGWENDNLDKQGVYLGPKIDPNIYERERDVGIF